MCICTLVHREQADRLSFYGNWCKARRAGGGREGGAGKGREGGGRGGREEHAASVYGCTGTL